MRRDRGRDAPARSATGTRGLDEARSPRLLQAADATTTHLNCSRWWPILPDRERRVLRRCARISADGAGKRRYRTRRLLASERDLALISDFLFEACVGFGEHPEDAFARTQARLEAFEGLMLALVERPDPARPGDDVLPGRRRLTRDRVVRDFDIDEAERKVRVLGAFMAGRDHRRTMLARLGRPSSSTHGVRGTPPPWPPARRRLRSGSATAGQPPNDAPTFWYSRDMATNIQATFGAGGGLTAGDFQLGFRRVGRDSGVTSPRRRCTTKHRRDDDKELYLIGRRRHALAKSFEERFCGAKHFARTANPYARRSRMTFLNRNPLMR